MQPGYVLLVEDDDAIADTISMVLEYEKGIKVQWAKDVDTAIRLFDSEKPTVILLDYVLESDNSTKFVEYSRKHSGDKPIPIILITAVSNSEALAEALRVNRLLKKPFTVEELIASITACRNC